VPLRSITTRIGRDAGAVRGRKEARIRYAVVGEGTPPEAAEGGEMASRGMSCLGPGERRRLLERGLLVGGGSLHLGVGLLRSAGARLLEKEAVSLAMGLPKALF
jgi:hypothetical protein